MLTNNNNKTLVVVVNQEDERNNNNNKNETTPLLFKKSNAFLKPSASSTDNPSWSNLVDCERAATRLLSSSGERQDSEISLTSLSYLDNDEGNTISEYGTTTLTARRRRRQRHAIHFALVLAASIVGLFTLRHFGFWPTSLPSHEKSSSQEDTNKPYKSIMAAFSQLDPVQDLGLANFQRPSFSIPSPGLASFILKQKKKKMQQQQQQTSASATASTAVVAIPTNAWYQNLLSVDDMPSTIHRAYTIPYIVDAAGPFAGLRIHPNHILAMSTVIQLNVVEQHGLIVGAAADAAASASATTTTESPQKHDDEVMNTRFHVENMTPLAVTLGWDDYPMSSPIVKGMPYATMRYESFNSSSIANGKIMLPTVASEVPFGNKESVLVDGGKSHLNCHHEDSSSSGTTATVRVDHEVQIYIPANDFTWLVFFSEPVMVRCSPLKKNADGGPEEEAGSMLQVVGSALGDARDGSNSKPFIIRSAILNTCTMGRNPLYCNHQEHVYPKQSLSLGQGDYGEILRSHAHLYPGPNADFSYEVRSKDYHEDDGDDDETTAILQFDWDVQDMGNAIQSSPSTDAATKVNETEPDLIMFSLMHHLDMMGPTPSLPGANNDRYCAQSLVGPACLIQGSAWNLVDELPQVSFRAPRPPAPWAIQDIANSLRNDITYTLPDYYQRGAGDTYFSGKMLARLARVLMIAEELGDLCSGHFTTAWERGLDNKDNQETSARAYAEACAAVDLPSEYAFTKALDSLRSSVEVWINGTAETPFVYDAAWGGVVSCGCNFDGNGCENKFPDCPAFYNPGLNFGNAFYNDMHFHYGYHIFAAAAVAHFDHDWGKRNFENVLLLIRNIANPSKEDSFFPIMRHKDVFQGHSWASGISRPYLNGKNQESSSEAIAAYESVALYGKVMAEVFLDNRRETREYEVAKAVRGVGKVMTAMELRSAKRYYHVRQSSTSESEIFSSTYTPHVIGIMWQTMAQFQTWFGNAPYLAYGIQLLPLTSISEDRDDVEWVKEMYPALAASCEMNGACTEGGWSVLQLSSLATVGHPHEAFDKALNLTSQVFESAGANGHSLSNTLWYIATRPPVEEPLSLIEKVTHDATHNAEADDHCPPCSRETCRGGTCSVFGAPYLCQSGSSIGGCSPQPWSLHDNQCEKCCKLTPECGQ